MIKAIILFIVGLLLLIKGGDWFVDGATGIAERFHIPEILIGATVVSIGTTLPEVMVSATSAAKGIGDMAYGNAIGSIICNTALVSAITIAVMPAIVEKKSLRFPVVFFFIAAIFYSAIAYVFKGFSRISGIILLTMFVVYMFINIRQAFTTPKNDGAAAEEADNEEEKKEQPLWKELILLVAGAAAIAFGANFLVENGTYIAEAVGIPKSVIALTFVALGTSLPELVTAITSLVKGHGALSLGNVIGANIFNLVLVSGISITIAPFSIPVEKTIAGMNASLVMDIPVMLAVMAIMTLPALIRGKLSRIQGISLLLIYFAYCVCQFVL